MNKADFLTVVFRSISVVLVLILFCDVGFPKPTKRDRALETAIQRYYSHAFGSSADHISYVTAYYDLNGDGRKEVIAYLYGDCGSGGCTMLILRRRKGYYSVVADCGAVQLPVTVSIDKNHGWHDIVVRGGRGDDVYYGVFSYDGNTYATRKIRKFRGKWVRTILKSSLTADDGVPLNK